MTLERLVELRSDKRLIKKLFGHTKHAIDLIAGNPDATLQGIRSQELGAEDEARAMAQAGMLAVYEETRRPYIELLRDIDKSAVVRARPHLHARLKELLDE